MFRPDLLTLQISRAASTPFHQGYSFLAGAPLYSCRHIYEHPSQRARGWDLVTKFMSVVLCPRNANRLCVSGGTNRELARPSTTPTIPPRAWTVAAVVPRVRAGCPTSWPSSAGKSFRPNLPRRKAGRERGDPAAVLVVGVTTELLLDRPLRRGVAGAKGCSVGRRVRCCPSSCQSLPVANRCSFDKVFVDRCRCRRQTRWSVGAPAAVISVRNV